MGIVHVHESRRFEPLPAWLYTELAQQGRCMRVQLDGRRVSVWRASRQRHQPDWIRRKHQDVKPSDRWDPLASVCCYHFSSFLFLLYHVSWQWIVNTFNKASFCFNCVNICTKPTVCVWSILLGVWCVWSISLGGFNGTEGSALN